MDRDTNTETKTDRDRNTEMEKGHHKNKEINRMGNLSSTLKPDSALESTALFPTFLLAIVKMSKTFTRETNTSLWLALVHKFPLTLKLLPECKRKDDCLHTYSSTNTPTGTLRKKQKPWVGDHPITPMASSLQKTTLGPSSHSSLHSCHG